MVNVFEPGSSHTATLKLMSAAEAAMTYDVRLWLGSPSIEVAAIDEKSVSFEPGETKDVVLTIVAPVAQDIYSVYVDFFYGGVVFLSYVGTEPVQVYAAPAIQIIDIIWT